MFFHTYFAKKNEKASAKAAKVDKRRDQDEESDAEESAAEEEADDGEEDDEAESDEDVVSLGGAEDVADSDEDSDAEEAEIWKVSARSMPCESPN